MLQRLRLTLEMIRFEHSVFALPFALTGAMLAFRESGGARGMPRLESQRDSLLQPKGCEARVTLGKPCHDPGNLVGVMPCWLGGESFARDEQTSSRARGQPVRASLLGDRQGARAIEPA